MINVTRAFARGMGAFHDRREPDANPYPEGSQDAREWRRGWNFSLQHKATRDRRVALGPIRNPQSAIRNSPCA